MQYLTGGVSSSQDISKTHLIHLAPALLGDRHEAQWALLYTAVKTNAMGPQTCCVIILLGLSKRSSEQDVSSFSKEKLVWLKPGLLRQKVRNQSWRICTPQSQEPTGSHHAQGIQSCLWKRCQALQLVFGSVLSMAVLQPATLERHFRGILIYHQKYLFISLNSNQKCTRQKHMIKIEGEFNFSKVLHIKYHGRAKK